MIRKIIRDFLKRSLTKAVVLSSVIGFSSHAYAGGFAVLEQSGRGLGQAFAGATTGFGDGSSAHFNPAAMTRLEGNVFSFTSNLIIPTSDFNGGASLPAALGGGAIAGSDGGNGGGVEFVPNFYAVIGLMDDRVKLGFAANAPFGLTSEFDDDWVGRYQAIKSELKIINLSPTIAFQINDILSVGAGLNVMYADVELTNAVDFGTIGVSNLGPQTASALGLIPGGTDGFARVEGDDWGVGYTVGALAQFDKTAIGINFKSKVSLNVGGEGEFEVPEQALPLTQTGAFTNSGATAIPSLPETISFDVEHQLSDKWDIAAGAIWTGWDRLQEIRIQFDNPVQPDNVTNLDWNSTWRFALGTSYEISDKLKIRTGYSYEETPIGSAETRTPRIPDEDRHWITAGITYEPCDDIELDLSYAHLFLSDGSVDHVGSTGDTLTGDFDLAIDIVALSLTWKPS